MKEISPCNELLQRKKSNIVSHEIPQRCAEKKFKLLDDDDDEDEDASENDENDEFDLLTDQEIPLVVEQ